MKPPVYNDGFFRLYKIIESDDTYPLENLKDMDLGMYYKELSIGDRTKIELQQNGVEVTSKIRIPQYKMIDSKCVLKIDDNYYRVYNVFHFRNKDGFLETDITLEMYRP
jgi:hypothetical protein